MAFIYLLIIGLVFFFILRAASIHPHRHRSRQTAGQTAMEMLREKYINGDIDEETYLKKRKIIK